MVNTTIFPRHRKLVSSVECNVLETEIFSRMLTQALDAAAEADLVEADLRVAMFWEV